jgi:hypothetical protein
MNVSLLLLILLFSSTAYSQSDSRIITTQDKKMCKSITGTKIKNNIDPKKLADNGSVYRVGSNRWTEEREVEFSQWFEENITEDFFKKYNIKTDCADAALAARAIFARIHHLPSMFYPKDDYIHTSKKWSRYKTVKNWNKGNWKESLKKDKRFRAALDHWKVGIGTVNLSISTHPVEVFNDDNSKLSKYMRPGCPILSGGHTRMIMKTDAFSFNPIKEASSTVPAKVRGLSMGNFYGFTLKESNLKDGAGVLGWNWPVNCGKGFVLVPDKRMPSYSEQQHELACSVGKIYENIKDPIPRYFGSLASLIARDPAFANPTKDTVTEELDNIAKLLKNRVDFVDFTLTELDSNREAFENKESSLYDEFSTHSRDKRLKSKIQELIEFVDSNSRALSMKKDDLIKLLLEKEFTSSDGTKSNLYHFYLAYKDGTISSEPSDSISKRFGGEFFDKRRVKVNKLNKQIEKIYQNKKDAVSALEQKNAKKKINAFDSMKKNILKRKISYNPDFVDATWKLWKIDGFNTDRFLSLSKKEQSKMISTFSKRDKKRIKPLMNIISNESISLETNKKYFEKIDKDYKSKTRMSFDNIEKSGDRSIDSYISSYVLTITNQNYDLKSMKENHDYKVLRAYRYSNISKTEAEYFKSK